MEIKQFLLTKVGLFIRTVLLLFLDLGGPSEQFVVVF